MKLRQKGPPLTEVRDAMDRMAALVAQSKSAELRREFDTLKLFIDTFGFNFIKKLDAGERPDFLRSLATNAKTIIDVGVWEGTPQLYKAFPDLPFVLIDPARGIEENLLRRPKNFKFVQKAIGDKKGKLTLNVNRGKTSLLNYKGVFGFNALERYDVEVDRLDTILEEVGAEGPFGIKMDIQGFELKAIRGMTRIWPQVDFLICEVNVRNTADSYQFSELVAELLKHDFAFFNILNNFKPTARFYDVAFLPRNSEKFNSRE